MHLPQTASEAMAEFRAEAMRHNAAIEWANDHINEYLDYYLPLFFDYCDRHCVDSAEPVDVFNEAGVPFIQAPTVETYLLASDTVH